LGLALDHDFVNLFNGTLGTNLLTNPVLHKS